MISVKEEQTIFNDFKLHVQLGFKSALLVSALQFRSLNSSIEKTEETKPIKLGHIKCYGS